MVVPIIRSSITIGAGALGTVITMCSHPRTPPCRRNAPVARAWIVPAWLGITMVIVMWALPALRVALAAFTSTAALGGVVALGVLGCEPAEPQPAARAGSTAMQSEAARDRTTPSG